MLQSMLSRRRMPRDHRTPRVGESRDRFNGLAASDHLPNAISAEHKPFGSASHVVRMSARTTFLSTVLRTSVPFARISRLKSATVGLLQSMLSSMRMPRNHRMPRGALLQSMPRGGGRDQIHQLDGRSSCLAGARSLGSPLDRYAPGRPRPGSQPTKRRAIPFARPSVRPTGSRALQQVDLLQSNPCQHLQPHRASRPMVPRGVVK